MAILIDLKRVDFEYDIWTLVREFCPHTEVLVNSTEKLAENDYIEYVVKVVFDEVNSKVLASILAPEASDTCKCTDLEDCQSRMHDKFSNEGIADYLDRKSVKN